MGKPNHVVAGVMVCGDCGKPVKLGVGGVSSCKNPECVGNKPRERQVRRQAQTMANWVHMKALIRFITTATRFADSSDLIPQVAFLLCFGLLSSIGGGIGDAQNRGRDH
jgi:hypothetical protein